MASIKEAIEEIKQAVIDNNGSVVGQYLNDGRPSVRAEANKAFLQMQSNPSEDKTPIPEEFKKKEKDVVQEKQYNPASEERKPPIRQSDWIDMTAIEAAGYEQQGILMGFDPVNELGLLKK